VTSVDEKVVVLVYQLRGIPVMVGTICGLKTNAVLLLLFVCFFACLFDFKGGIGVMLITTA